MRWALSNVIVFVATTAAILTVAGPAHARKSSDFTYRYEQVWSAAVRMVRVDLRFRVEDQDPEIGYVLFQYRDTSGRTHPGSIELVATEVEGAELVRAVVQIPAMPSYIEQMLLDRLGQKLRSEFGEPPPRRPRREPSPPSEDDENNDEEAEEEPEEDTRRRPRRIVRGRRG
ncbi:MAG: hypothetical protein AAGF12_10875 [Myxococcota bacterium]